MAKANWIHEMAELATLSTAELKNGSCFVFRSRLENRAWEVRLVRAVREVLSFVTKAASMCVRLVRLALPSSTVRCSDSAPSE